MTRTPSIHTSAGLAARVMSSRGSPSSSKKLAAPPTLSPPRPSKPQVAAGTEVAEARISAGLSPAEVWIDGVRVAP